MHIVQILYFAAIQSTNPYITHVAPELEISHEFYQICYVHGDSDIIISKNKNNSTCFTLLFLPLLPKVYFEFEYFLHTDENHLLIEIEL